MSIQTQTPKRRRKRGVVLTAAGLARFQAAKANAEYAENKGQRYTLEMLSERTNVSIDTLAKVLGCETRVDKQTLKYCFRSFELDLKPTDYYSPGPTQAQSSFGSANGAPKADPAASFSPSPPDGQLPVDSSLYIERAKVETESFKAIILPGSLLRIKGARRTGKTSLMARIAQRALQQGYQPVSISFQLADKQVLQDLDSLLQWFCASVGLEMGVSPNLDTYWDSLFGSKVSCKLYFEQYLLAMTQRPVVLMLDDVERLFRYPDIADEFFGLLRTWYEEAKTSDIWQQLRMVIAQSSEVYIPLNINKSPFNVGVAVSLPPLTPAQVQTLANAYDLDWSLQSAKELCQLVDGQPYLVHQAVYHIWQKETTLVELLTEPLSCRVFSAYLRHQLRVVQQGPQLAKALEQILTQQSLPPAMLSSLYQLQGMGLIALKNDGPRVACDLFMRYFSAHFAPQSSSYAAAASSAANHSKSTGQVARPSA
ncbi:MAG: AAA-like domain-containing protein [Cyanobacteria bacterium P01_A01_bin.114]